MSILHTCTCVYCMYAWCLRGQKSVSDPPGTGEQLSCYMNAGNRSNTGPLEKQPVLLTSEPYFQPHYLLSYLR